MCPNPQCPVLRRRVLQGSASLPPPADLRRSWPLRLPTPSQTVSRPSPSARLAPHKANAYKIIRTKPSNAGAILSQHTINPRQPNATLCRTNLICGALFVPPYTLHQPPAGRSSSKPQHLISLQAAFCGLRTRPNITSAPKQCGANPMPPTMVPPYTLHQPTAGRSSSKPQHLISLQAAFCGLRTRPNIASDHHTRQQIALKRSGTQHTDKAIIHRLQKLKSLGTSRPEAEHLAGVSRSATHPLGWVSARASLHKVLFASGLSAFFGRSLRRCPLLVQRPQASPKESHYFESLMRGFGQKKSPLYLYRRQRGNMQSQ